MAYITGKTEQGCSTLGVMKDGVIVCAPDVPERIIKHGTATLDKLYNNLRKGYEIAEDASIAKPKALHPPLSQKCSIITKTEHITLSKSIFDKRSALFSIISSSILYNLIL